MNYPFAKSRRLRSKSPLMSTLPPAAKAKRKANRARRRRLNPGRRSVEENRKARGR